MVLRNSRKLLLIAGVALLVITGALTVYVILFNDSEKNEDQVAIIQDSETEIIPEQSRESLENGSCSDEDLAIIIENKQKYVKTASEEKSLKDIADCYVLRRDYDNAKNAFAELERFYRQVGDIASADSTAGVIRSIETITNLPEQVPEEVESDEPLAN